MGNVLKMAKKQQIEALAVLGWSDRMISKEIGVDRGTVSKYRKMLTENQPKVPTEQNIQNPPIVPADQNGTAVGLVPARLPSTKSSQLQPYLESIKTLYCKRLTAQRIYQDLVEQHGYRGSYDSVKRFVRKLRKRYRRYHERLPHLPGREAQVDFGKSTCYVMKNGRYRKVWLFKMTLSCSKHAYEELVEKQDLETFIRCHERGFAFFGGVPEIVTLDNVKSGVLQAHLYEPVLNQPYYAFAKHWGFAANPCIPYTPEHKGVVERDIGYTKHNALEGKRFESLDEGNLYLKSWNKRWARNRIHGTTKCQVWKLFCELEQPALHALASSPFEYFHPGKRIVDVNGLIEVDSRYYGVPPKYVGDTVIVHFNQKFVKIYYGQDLIITHRTLPQKGKVNKPLSCFPEWKHPDQESQESYYLRQARKAGPNLHAAVYSVLSTGGPLAIRRVRGLLSLEKVFGAAILEDAAEQARRVANYSYHFVKMLCKKHSECIKPELILTQQHDLIRSLKEYETIFAERTDS